MNKRVMIVVWRWELDKEPFEIDIDNDRVIDFACLDVKVDKSDDKFIIITCPYSTYKIEDTVAKHMREYDIELLLHGGNPDRFMANSYDIVNIDFFIERDKRREAENEIAEFILPNSVKVHLFSGEEPLIQKKVLSAPPNSITGNNRDFLIDDKVFNELWDYYYKGDVKKKLINHLLPIAIDIQGLKLCSKDSNKVERYLEAINYNDNDKYCNDLKTLLKDLPEIRLPFSKENLNGKDIKRYIEENHKIDKNSDDFFPNWLVKNIQL